MGLIKSFSGFVFLLFVAACATPPPVSDRDLPSDLAKFSVMFDVVNQKILGEVLLEANGDASSFNLEKYKSRLGSMVSKRPAELFEELKYYDQQQLKAYPKTFVICVYSRKKGVAMCDDSRCTGVERKMLSKDSKIIEGWLKELPLQACLTR